VLFENPGWPANKWIKLELEGRTANRSAIGARVEVDVVAADGEKRTVRRTVNTGGSFGSGSLQLHIGLGRATRIGEVRIQWPDSARSKTTYSDLSLNSAYHVRQGDKPALLSQAPVPFLKKALGTPGAAGEHKHN
jgi:hypothetical protein